MVCDGCNYFFIMGHFLPFYPLTARKIKILKKWKKLLEIGSFYMCVPKIIIRWYTLPEIWCVTDVVVISHFGIFLALLTPKILKKWKKAPGDIIILHRCTKNYDQIMYGSWHMVRDKRTDRRTDGWTDGQKKWHSIIAS